MLVLTRKQSEMIHIGDDIVIKVIRTGRGSVKIGVQAPDEVRVLRAELLENPRTEAPRPAGARKGDILDLGEHQLSDFTAVCSDQFPHPHIA
jgi:carbon storage regulator